MCFEKSGHDLLGLLHVLDQSITVVALPNSRGSN
jgi:hypothetical protein